MFGLLIPHRPLLPSIPSVSPTQFALTVPTQPPFHTIAIFMHPDAALPPDMAAAVYMQLPSSPEVQFLGALANEKQSAMFRVNLPPNTTGDVQVGVSVEPVEQVKASLDQLAAAKTNPEAVIKKPSTKLLAQRIIKNAFNFLAGFSGNLENGVEVVPLKSFQDWWVKFERRVENDPGFLEREQD